MYSHTASVLLDAIPEEEGGTTVTPIVKVELDLTSDLVPTGDTQPQEGLSNEQESSRDHTPTDQEDIKAPTLDSGPADSEQVNVMMLSLSVVLSLHTRTTHTHTELRGPVQHKE